MDDWNSSEAPVGKEIEFEIDGREIQRGRLRYGGSGGVGRLGAVRLNTLYIIEGDSSRLFEVTRWREVE